MDEVDTVDAGETMRPGDRLRAARQALGLDLSDIATRTRVTQRHLQLLEENDFDALPGPTYAIGFARAYARAVDLGDAEIAAAVRAELAASGSGPNHYEMFEPADPARVPPRMLAWTGVILALLIAAGYGIWRTQLFSPAPTTARQQSPSAPVTRGTNVTVPIAPSGQVVLTASAPVWLRIYDEDGNRLLEKEMQAGETYAVPGNARNPMILTGRPDALAVTVGGRAVPPLGAGDKSVDMPISAAALLARPAAPAAPAAPAGN